MAALPLSRLVGIGVAGWAAVPSEWAWAPSWDLVPGGPVVVVAAAQVVAQTVLFGLLRPTAGALDAFRADVSGADAARSRDDLHAGFPAAVGRVTLLCSPGARRAGEGLAVRAGVLLDELWPSLLTVVPPHLRRRHQVVESALAAVIAVGAVAVPALVAARWFGAASLPLAAVLLAWSVWSGRVLADRAYRMRAATAEVHLFDLAEALHLPLPARHSALPVLGRWLNGEKRYADGPELVGVAWTSTRGAGGDAVGNHRGRGRPLRVDEDGIDPGELVRRLREEVSRELADHRSVVDGLLVELVKRAVQEAVAGPEVADFTGYLAVELLRGAVLEGSTVVASPAASFTLGVSVPADPTAADTVPERGIALEHGLIALEPIHLRGGEVRPEVSFDVLVDGPELRPAPRRASLDVPRPMGERTARVALRAPEEEGRHETWLQLYQQGQLVQMVMLSVEVRTGAGADG